MGRSLVVGKPVSVLLLDRHATVTTCHSRTGDLPAIVRKGDVVILATGRAKAYGRDFFHPGQTVLDVGINVDEAGNLCGDADFDAIEPIVDAITPVPARHWRCDHEHAHETCGGSGRKNLLNLLNARSV